MCVCVWFSEGYLQAGCTGLSGSDWNLASLDGKPPCVPSPDFSMISLPGGQWGQTREWVPKDGGEGCLARGCGGQLPRWPLAGAGGHGVRVSTTWSLQGPRELQLPQEGDPGWWGYEGTSASNKDSAQTAVPWKSCRRGRSLKGHHTSVLFHLPLFCQLPYQGWWEIRLGLTQAVLDLAAGLDNG